MAKGKVQGITYLWDRIIVGFLHTSFNSFFVTVLVAGGVGVQDEGAGSSGRAMSGAPIAGGGAVSVEGVSCPDLVPTTAIVTSSAIEGDGSALSTSMATLFWWGALRLPFGAGSRARKTRGCKTGLSSVFSKTTRQFL
jgi:hypothetical protein